MAKTIKIPNNMKPYYEVEIGNKKYRYPAGTTQSVPDEVAAVIEANSNMRPKENPPKDYEEWEFTLADGKKVTKKVVVR